jgi:4a-hydroxytetrahydrobiopterin dehydratase
MPHPPIEPLLSDADPDSTREVLAAIQGWRVSADGLSISRSFDFPHFVVAFGFMSQVALLAARLDHHPSWSNVGGRVDISLTTAEAGSLTELDMTLAAEINAAFLRASPAEQVGEPD